MHRSILSRQKSFPTRLATQLHQRAVVVTLSTIGRRAVSKKQEAVKIAGVSGYFLSLSYRGEAGITLAQYAPTWLVQMPATAATIHLCDAWQLFSALPVRKYVERTEQVAEKWGVSLCKPPLTLP